MGNSCPCGQKASLPYEAYRKINFFVLAVTESCFGFVWSSRYSADFGTVPENLNKITQMAETKFNSYLIQIHGVLVEKALSSLAFIEVSLRRNPAEVRVPSGQKPRTEIIYIVLHTTV